ncbi:multidrug effflux MFS transporter [Rhodovibrionaceae bacterium A322]
MTTLSRPPQAEADSVRPRPHIAILVAISAIGPLALNIFIPSMPGLQQEFSVDYSSVQLTLTLYLIGLAVSQLFYGPLSDRYGRRPALLCGLALFVVASFAATLAPTIEWLIVTRIFQAVGGASGLVLSRAIVRDLYERDKAASVIGYITMAWVLAPMLAPTIGGLLELLLDWRGGFYLVALAGAGVWLAALRWLHETHHNRTGGEGLLGLLSSYGLLMKNSSFWVFTATLSFSSCAFFSFLGGVPYVMMEVLGETPLAYGLWFGLTAIGYMAGNGIAGRFSQQLGGDRMVFLGTGASFLGALAMLVSLWTGELTPATIFIPMFFVALGNGMSIPNGVAGAVSVMPAIAGAAAGLAGFLQTAIGAVGSQSVGYLQGDSPFVVFYVMGAFTLAAWLVPFLGKRTQDPAKQTA